MTDLLIHTTVLSLAAVCWRQRPPQRGGLGHRPPLAPAKRGFTAVGAARDLIAACLSVHALCCRRPRPGTTRARTA